MLLSPDHQALRTPAKAAVIMGSGETLDYATLSAHARRIAAYLRAKGLRTGDHVAGLLENRIELFEFAWACQRIGLHYTLINTHLLSSETALILRDCAPRAFAVSRALLDRMPELHAELPAISLRLIVGGAVDGFTPWEEIRDTGALGVIPNETEGQWMLYSSGTTGRPKGIKRALREVEYGTPTPGEQVMAARWGFSSEVVLLSAGPLYHMGPLSFAMGTLRHGGTVIVMDRFDAQEALSLIQQFKVTHLFMVPTHFVRMLNLPAEIRCGFDPRSLRTVLHAGAPCPIPVKERMIDWWGPILQEFYGTTEAIGTCIIDSKTWLTHKGSVGQPINCQISILDADGHEMPRGQAGIVHFAGNAAFTYFNDPARTAAAFDAQGRVSVGDVGYLDAEGYLYLTGRVSDIIISGGVNIAPEEVETALASHEAVLDCAVAGMADPEYGERVHGFVVLADKDPGQTDDGLAAELIGHCRTRLASFKCPRGITFISELPRTPSGKLLRRVLRDDGGTS